MSRRGLLRSLGRCCLGLVALLVAGSAAEVLPISLTEAFVIFVSLPNMLCARSTASYESGVSVWLKDNSRVVDQSPRK